MTQDRRNAVTSLNTAQDVINAIPDRDIPVELATARLAQAQTYIQAAAVHALLDLADAIREGRDRA